MVAHIPTSQDVETAASAAKIGGESAYVRVRELAQMYETAIIDANIQRKTAQKKVEELERLLEVESMRSTHPAHDAQSRWDGFRYFLYAGWIKLKNYWR